MAIQIPEFKNIRDPLVSDIRLNSGVTDIGKLRLANTIGESVAAGIYSLYGNLQFIAGQLFPDSADAEHLVRAGKWRGYTLTEAKFAKGAVIITGTAGTSLAADYEFQSAKGMIYKLIGTAVIGTTGTVTTEIIAAEAGASGNYTGTLYTVQSNANVTGIATTGTGITGGADQETIEALRQRILTVNSGTNLYGKAGDYVAWAKASSSLIAQAWERPNIDNIGTLGVYVNGVSGIPDAATVNAAQVYIEGKVRKEVVVSVKAVVEKTIVFNIAILPDTTDNRSNVSTKISDYIYANAEPGGNISLSALSTYVSANVTLTSLNITLPTADITSNPNELIKYGSVNY